MGNLEDALDELDTIKAAADVAIGKIHAEIDSRPPVEPPVEPPVRPPVEPPPTSNMPREAVVGGQTIALELAVDEGHGWMRAEGVRDGVRAVYYEHITGYPVFVLLNGEPGRPHLPTLSGASCGQINVTGTIPLYNRGCQVLGALPTDAYLDSLSYPTMPVTLSAMVDERWQHALTNTPSDSPTQFFPFMDRKGAGGTYDGAAPGGHGVAVYGPEWAGVTPEGIVCAEAWSRAAARRDWIVALNADGSLHVPASLPQGYDIHVAIQLPGYLAYPTHAEKFDSQHFHRAYGWALPLARLGHPWWRRWLGMCAHEAWLAHFAPRPGSITSTGKLTWPTLRTKYAAAQGKGHWCMGRGRYWPALAIAYADELGIQSHAGTDYTAEIGEIAATLSFFAETAQNSGIPQIEDATAPGRDKYTKPGNPGVIPHPIVVHREYAMCQALKRRVGLETLAVKSSDWMRTRQPAHPAEAFTFPTGGEYTQNGRCYLAEPLAAHADSMWVGPIANPAAVIDQSRTAAFWGGSVPLFYATRGRMGVTP